MAYRSGSASLLVGARGLLGGAPPTRNVELGRDAFSREPLELELHAAGRDVSVVIAGRRRDAILGRPIDGVRPPTPNRRSDRTR